MTLISVVSWEVVGNQDVKKILSGGDWARLPRVVSSVISSWTCVVVCINPFHRISKPASVSRRTSSSVKIIPALNFIHART